ncbi:methylcobamide--CoM methyltransferase [Methanosarcina sp. KYL-1]|uniref:uroporphyrinogen decarboxylase family protein n=1 Tax=Methanosarcina sp. KYL-1 TaxID=2602068 RepID=UPI0021016BDF|nr:uroporphyrinogen decarboxylase family protein [Methanosarcina sp. KYL-1]MCQ1537012.1 methylcobamide--CoM methyltransferase [Methanosarcina sp. KYL-1]
MTAEMTSRERFINALEQKDVDRIPYGYLWFGAGHAVLERMGASLKDVYYSAEGIAKAQVLAREMYHHDNVMSPWGCLLVEAEALGTKVNVMDNRYPTVAKYALKSAGEHEQINPRDLERSERVKAVSGSVEILKKELGDEAFILGATMSPLMLASQVMGGSRLCIDMLKDRDGFHALLENLTESCILFSEALLEAGADGIFVENGENTGDLFSPQMAEEFMLPYTKELYDRIKAEGGYVISHNCAAHAFYDLELKLEPHALNFAFGDVRELGKKYGVECEKLHNHKNIGCGPRYCVREFKAFSDAGICLMGNIIPNAPLTGGRAEIEHEVKSCLNAAPEKGFILATGCEIPLNSPLENMEAMWEAIKARF